MQYADIAQSYLNRRYPGLASFKTVFPSWDNTARTKDRALVVLNGIPDNYEYWLSSRFDIVQKESGKNENMVFINAWNEWAEGCHLEPDRWFGHGFLEATLNAKNGLRRFATFPEMSLPNVCKPYHRKFSKDLFEVFSYHAGLKLGNLKLAVNRRPWLRLMLLPIFKAFRGAISNSGK